MKRDPRLKIEWESWENSIYDMKTRKSEERRKYNMAKMKLPNNGQNFFENSLKNVLEKDFF